MLSHARIFSPMVIALLATSLVVSASEPTVRELVDADPDLKIYGVIFGITNATDGGPPNVRFARVIDPSTGSIESADVEVPDEYIQAAKAKLVSSPLEAAPCDEEQKEFFTYFIYVPGYPSIVIVDLDKSINAQ